MAKHDFKYICTFKIIKVAQTCQTHKLKP